VSEGPRNLIVGSVGGTPIEIDVRDLGADVVAAVQLSADYAMLTPPGYPFRPHFTGTDTPQYPHVIASGTTVRLLKPEAAALVAAGAATYA
jgi:hypothetical protein